MPRKKKVDNSLIVEKFEAPVEPVAAAMAFVHERMRLKMTVDQAVDVLAAYQQPPHGIVRLDSQNGSGACLACGEATNAPERCLCWECHGKLNKAVYEGLKFALQNGESEFEINL